MAFLWNDQVLLSRFITITPMKATWGHKREELGLPAVVVVLIFRNAFITASFTSHSELTLTPFSWLFEKTHVILWYSKILQTKKDGEIAIFEFLKTI